MENENITETQDAVQRTDAPASLTVVGVRFRSCGKIYTFEVGDVDVIPGSKVVVDSKMGLSLGQVATQKYVIEKKGEPLKKVLRIATEEDFETAKSNRSYEEEAKFFCIDKVKQLNLPMKIVMTETTLDKKRIVFYFTADGRIDFRELVRDLASKFKTRIEMRQIGVRDEVKLLGGLGCCGRQVCCSLFLTSFEPITIRMAKKQELSINQSKLSGICGRLMCCLGYEVRNAQGRDRVSAAQEEDLVTITEEPLEEVLETEVNEEKLEKESKGVTDQVIQKDVLQKKEEPSKPVSEQQATRKRRFRRPRRRFKGQRKEETSEKEKQTTSEGAQRTNDGQEKGKPFSKRRRFRKKKKQQ